MVKKVARLFLAIVVYLYSSKVVAAQLVISEVYSQPNFDESEWFEVQNLATVSANLNNWTVFDELATPKLIYKFENLVLQPQEFFVATVSNQLNNGGDGLKIYTDLGQVAAQMSYGASQIGQSWSRVVATGVYSLTIPTPNQANQFSSPSPSASPSISPTPSPSATSTPSPSPSPSLNFQLTNLQLKRAAICPSSGSEWLEWENQGNDPLQTEVVIKDLQANSLHLNLQIAPQSTQITNLVRSIFNNSGDELFVYAQDDQLFHYQLTGCTKSDDQHQFQPDLLWANLVSSQSPITSTASPSANLSTATRTGSGLVLGSVNLAANYSLPEEVLVNLNSVLNSSQAGIISSASSQRASLPTTVKTAHQVIWPTHLVTGGGFLWLGLGIMMVYGQKGKSVQIVG